MARGAAQPEGCWAKGTAGLTLDIQQREMVVVGGFRRQREVETVAALRLIPVHNADCLDQLWGEGRGEHQCCFHSLSQGPTCRVQHCWLQPQRGTSLQPCRWAQWDQQSDSHCDRGCTDSRAEGDTWASWHWSRVLPAARDQGWGALATWPGLASSHTDAS